jgi:hypothetical protein
VSRAVFFDLEPGVIDASPASPLVELFGPGNLVNQNAGAGNNWAKAHCPSRKFDIIEYLDD